MDSLKNSLEKPSGPGALLFLPCLMAVSTSVNEIGEFKSCFELSFNFGRLSRKCEYLESLSMLTCLLKKRSE